MAETLQERQKRPRIAPGLYRVHWQQGGTSEAAIGCGYDGDNWIAPTNWVSTAMIRDMEAQGSWGDIDRLERIEMGDDAPRGDNAAHWHSQAMQAREMASAWEREARSSAAALAAETARAEAAEAKLAEAREAASALRRHHEVIYGPTGLGAQMSGWAVLIAKLDRALSRATLADRGFTCG